MFASKVTENVILSSAQEKYHICNNSNKKLDQPREKQGKENKEKIES